MTRKFIDCREYPSEMHCSVAISADTESELMDAAVQHVVSVHKEADTSELREHIKRNMKEGMPQEQSAVSH